MKEWLLINATIISALRSTKNVERKRDPEMSLTKKQSPVSRYEIAYWAGCSIRVNSFMSLHIGKCARYYCSQSMMTRRRRGCFCGFRIYRNWETSGNQVRSILACHVKKFVAPKNATTRSHWRTDWPARKDNRLNSRQGRTSVSHDKIPVRFYKNKYRGFRKNESNLYILFALSNVYLMSKNYCTQCVKCILNLGNNMKTGKFCSFNSFLNHFIWILTTQALLMVSC